MCDSEELLEHWLELGIVAGRRGTSLGGGGLMQIQNGDVAMLHWKRTPGIVETLLLLLMVTDVSTHAVASRGHLLTIRVHDMPVTIRPSATT